MQNGLLEGKNAVVVGVANRRSIAWGIAQAWRDAGANIYMNYQNDRLKEKVTELAIGLGAAENVAQCDVSSDEEIASFADFVKAKAGRVDMLLHSVAFAPKEALTEPYVNTSREAFLTAHDISVYSLVGLSRAFAPLFTDGGSILTLTFYGSEKVFPNYNVMGVCKAALEASVRYLAHELGTQKIRVNAISAGPVNTVAARGIAGFTDMLKHYEEIAPLRRSCELEEVGQTAAFLASPGAGAITGQIVYVDGGYQVMGM